MMKVLRMIRLPRDVDDAITRAADRRGVDVVQWLRETIEERLRAEGESDAGRATVTDQP
jgi:predicted HicB family RNase H-like nuclease